MWEPGGRATGGDVPTCETTSDTDAVFTVSETEET